MKYVDEILKYGVRLYTEELDITIHQFLYAYNNNRYVITMKKGEVISCYEIV